MRDLMYLAAAALMSILFASYTHAEPVLIPPLHAPAPNEQGFTMVIDVERVILVGKLMELRNKLEGLKESAYDLIIEECHRDFMPHYVSEFYYCTLSNMFAVTRVLGHYDRLIEEITNDERDADDIAEEFVKLVDLFEKHKTDDSYGGFDFPALLEEYEEYLKGKE